MKFSAIILAGGMGERFGSQKQLEIIEGFPMWEYVFRKVSPFFDEVVVAGVDCLGGVTRRESIKNAMSTLKRTDYVIIIESARPLVGVDQIKLLKKATYINDSVSFYKKLTNTIYDGFGFAREGIFEVLTPQGFNFKLLQNCLDKDKDKNPTDECQTIEKLSKKKTFWLEGDYRLNKVTYREDLEVIRSLNKYNKKLKNGGNL